MFDYTDDPVSKLHSKYNWLSKNTGKDFIYSNRLKLAEKLGVDIRTKVSNKMYSYIMKAELGIILL